MNKPAHISQFLLERYRLGEIDTDEKLRVEAALANDSALAAALADLDRADQDFWQRFDQFNRLSRFNRGRLVPETRKARRLRPSVVWGLCAAALVLVIALPVFILKNPAQSDFGDRIKGTSAELSVYLKGNSSGGDIKLPDQAGISMGNTVQLAYRVQGDSSGEQYGVIFSIDGRASVTMHYPYTLEQSTRLISGKLVPLDEAYTLDDAPDYEMFFFVVAGKPLEVKTILNTARQLAPKIPGNTQKAMQQGTSAFKGCELQVLTLRKE
ncbi:MAG: hypothetical protein LBG91_03295 [Treponema sp.]|jgi:hypothetical protein|nr:hypothetical protein [Treponema sp.]